MKLGILFVVIGQICTNNSFATGGRIWLLWNSALFEVDILDISPQTIHTKIIIRGSQTVFMFTLVYGFNKPAERVELWQSLQRYSHMSQGPWMAIGSFFTWNNKHDLETLVYSRLDRCLINDDWVNIFPEAYAYLMPEGYFDHCPCVVYPYGKPVTRKPTFKYFNMWRLDANFNKLNKGPMGDIENKVKVAKLALFKIQEELVSNPMEPTMVASAKDLFDELLNLETAWHMFMDQKTKLKNRRAKNKVIQIKDSNGKLCTTSSDIQQAFISFYKELLGSSNEVDPVCVPILNAGTLLNEAHYEILNAEVSSD
ncbi:uncharacterized protein LOC141617472 [Silene latifolia]|uniref:uncharacterized protein LOC141617472 n=1 Tax=Silene latifolia TaxID=37657 RepID=UPI003D786EFD